MRGSIPNVLVILLAVATYGSLAMLIMRFALRASREQEARYPQRPRGPGAGGTPAQPALAPLQPQAVLDRGGSPFQALASQLPDDPAAPTGALAR